MHDKKVGWVLYNLDKERHWEIGNGRKEHDKERLVGGEKGIMCIERTTSYEVWNKRSQSVIN